MTHGDEISLRRYLAAPALVYTQWLTSPLGGYIQWNMHKSKTKGHQAHEDVTGRLKRAKGHLESVIKMIEEEKACLDVARQLYAVSKAIDEAKRIFIQDHIEHCLDESALDANDMTIKDFKEITKYL